MPQGQGKGRGQDPEKKTGQERAAEVNKGKRGDVASGGKRKGGQGGTEEETEEGPGSLTGGQMRPEDPNA